VAGDLRKRVEALKAEPTPSRLPPLLRDQGVVDLFKVPVKEKPVRGRRTAGKKPAG